jgi:hypothetical protein
MGNESLRSARSLAAAAVVLSLAGSFAAPVVFARIAKNTIDPTAIVTDRGRHVVVTGPISCDAREQAFIDVTVTQRTTGAMAFGRTLRTCNGDTHQWRAHAVVLDKERFEEGPATVVAAARTSDDGEITDAHQWLVDVTLIRRP